MSSHTHLPDRIRPPGRAGVRTDVPSLRAPFYLTDGGLETTLVFGYGLDLPDFAAFPLLDRKPEVFVDYFTPYLDVARRDGVGFVFDTPTWRASSDWGARLGYSPAALFELNQRAVGFMRDLAARWPEVDAVVNGVIGPRGDGYAVGETMSPDEAERYHRAQARAFVEAGADLVTAVTMTYTGEAIGIARAAIAEGIPVAISFTVETDGCLPSGQALSDAIEEVDAAIAERSLHAGRVAYYMINCAHPQHFAHELERGARSPDAAWLGRIEGIRANASKRSHAELDAAEALDRGEPVELGADYVALHDVLPRLRIAGGCCGSDHEHIDEISRALAHRLGVDAAPGAVPGA